MVLVDGLPDSHGYVAQDAAQVGPHQMLHLESVHDADRLPLADDVALADQQLADRALDRRTQRCGVGWAHGLGFGPARPHGDDSPGVAAAIEVQPRQGVGRARLRRRRLVLAGQQGAGVLVDPARVHGPGDEVVVVDDGPQELDVGFGAGDLERPQGELGSPRRILEISRGRVCDHLGQQRVEAGIRGVARVAVGVDTDARPRRRLEDAQPAARRSHTTVSLHALEIHARLERIAARRGRLRQADAGQRLTTRDAQLRLHQVDASYFFRHGVLHLEPRVRLDEGVVAGIEIDQELERAQAAVLGRLGQAQRCARQRPARFGVDPGAGRDLDQLLMASLDGALPLAQSTDGAAAIPDHLDLQVPRPRHETFHVDRRVAKRCLRFGLAACVGLIDRRGVGDDSHAATSTAAHRLQHHGSVGPQSFQERSGLSRADRPLTARQDGHVVLRRECPRAGLVAEQFQRLDLGAHERESRCSALRREGWRLGQEAVAGVDRVAAGVDGEGNDLLSVEIGARTAAIERQRLGRCPGV